MKSIYTGLALYLFWAGAVAAQDQAESWRRYTNERFGFSLLLPSRVFAVEKQSDAGDGLVFVSKDGETRLLVGALLNADAQTPSRYQDYLAKQSYADYNITYRRGGDSWFVLSGEGNGKTFYEKVMFSCSGRLINSFAMLYPTKQRKTFDPIVERIENSSGRPPNVPLVVPEWTFRAGVFARCAQEAWPAAEALRKRAMPAGSTSALSK